MSRLIDADELLKKQRNMTIYDEGGWDMQVRAVSVEDIENAPVINTEYLRPRGRWVYHECVSSYDGIISGYSCSECNAFVNEEVFDADEFHKDFCGNCGAKMEENNEHS